MSALDDVKDALPEAAKDIRLNLSSVLSGGALSPAQRWETAVASAIAARSPRLREALLAEARLEVEEAVLEDARAAAALMAMNNVYYRFRHVIGKPSYSEKPARLRMNRLAQVAGAKADFELACLAVSAINGCEACVRIAATVQAAAVSLEILEEHPLPAARAAATA
jgi:alkyl hydroperoxide reductase subunit D